MLVPSKLNPVCTTYFRSVVFFGGLNKIYMVVNEIFIKKTLVIFAV